MAMTLNDRLNAFAELGNMIRRSLDGEETVLSKKLQAIADSQYLKNPWFTPENVRLALESVSENLRPYSLIRWTAAYPALAERKKPLNVGVIMAGNIPLVGFHDFLSVLVSGNRIIAKTSSKDCELLKFLSEMLLSINREFEEYIIFTEGRLSGFDAVIATGSDNSSRYFEYYFGKYPHIIRKNRNSVAIIRGDETGTDIENLGMDVFSYFGLGCRSVSKVYLPDGFDPAILAHRWNSFSGIVSHAKYANNYEYNMAVYLVNRIKFLDTGFIIMKEDRGLSSPVAVLYYQYYDPASGPDDELQLFREKIQCIVSSGHIPFGKAQKPDLWDYSDNIDTLDFLLKKNMPGIL